MADTPWQNITVIGLGSQGLAWAKNLRDSGRNISCFLRPHSPKIEKAQKLGFKTVQNFSDTDVILLLIPDHAHLTFLKENIDRIPRGTNIIYAHGASAFEHNLIAEFPQWNHLLLAPKAIASEVRLAKLEGNGLGAVYSVEGVTKDKEKTRKSLLALAKDLAVSAGPFEVTFSQEARADLLSEQSLLCGLIPYAAKACFDQLVSAGIPKELAYLEAWHEVKLIGNAMAEKGPVDFYNLISPHALVGGQMASELIFDHSFQETMEKLKEDIWSGAFFEKVKEVDFEELREQEVKKWSNHTLQSVYENLNNELSQGQKS
jgi:ketol-acid reductoisomerase